MNAFRKLLLAPVALGLAAPLAAQAQSFDMGNVNRYTQQQDTDRDRCKQQLAECVHGPHTQRNGAMRLPDIHSAVK